MSYYPQNPPPTYYQPQPTVSGLAVAGFILSLVGISLLGLVLSACALPEINRGQKSGKGLAIAGLILGILGSLIWFIFVVGVGASAR